MNRLSRQRRLSIAGALTEGTSLRGTARATGVGRQAIERLLRDLGVVCHEHLDAQIQGLDLRHIQCDEIWAFIYCKHARVLRARQAPPEAGDVWLWTALDHESRLIPAWLVGRRDQEAATSFMNDLAARVTGRVQITTDGLWHYQEAIETAFGSDADYGQIIKIYADDDDERRGARYSASRCIASYTRVISGRPDPAFISTEYVERQNHRIRTDMRRYTRLTNGFSKSIDMHQNAVALHMWNYNFARIHHSLDGITPAMAAGVTDRLWDLDDLIDLLEEWEAARDTASTIALRGHMTRRRNRSQHMAQLHGATA